MQFFGLSLLAIAAGAAAYDFELGVTSFYNGIDTIGGSGTTAHFQGVVVTCKNGKELCRVDDGSSITCKGDKEKAIGDKDQGCRGLAIFDKSTLNCGKEKITACSARAPGADTITRDELDGGYSNFGLGSSETSRCTSKLRFTFDDAIPNPCAK